MKIKSILGASILLLVSAQAGAATIVRTSSINLDSALLSNTVIFEAIYFNTVTLDVGDTFVFNIDFGGDALKVVDLTGSSNELMSWQSVALPSGSNTGFHWDTTFSFDGVSGDLLTNDFTLGFGGPIGAFLPNWNLTNTEFSFTDLSLVFDIDFKEPGRTSYVTEQIDFRASFNPSGGGRFQAVPPIPIPAALPLFLSALGALGFVGWRRRRA